MSAAADGGESETAAAREEARGAVSHQLAEALGRPADLPRETAERAAVDPLYLHGLIAQSSGTSLPKRAPRPTPVLLARAARTLARWAAAGFGQVSPEVAERRRRACLSCPELRAPDGHPLHRLAVAGGSGVCGLCSCAVEKKAMLPTESCPAPAPDDPARNRWAEPRD